jgi:hypothetical protein
MNNIGRAARTLVLLGLAIPLFAASPELLVGGTVFGPAPDLRDAFGVATDGTDFFAVWVDGRTPEQWTVYGARVRRDGRVLDPLGIRIATGPQSPSPILTWDGSAWLVVWTAGPPASTHDDAFTVYASRIGRDGRFVMRPRPIVENATAGGAASNGNVSVITYTRSDGYTSESRIAVLDRDGNALSDEALPDGIIWTPAVAATPSRFLLAWSVPTLSVTQPDRLMAMTLTADGRPDGAPTQIGWGNWPGIRQNGADFLVFSWRDGHEVERYTLLSRVVRPDLTASADEILTSWYDVDGLDAVWRNGRWEVTAGGFPEASAPAVVRSFDLDAEGRVSGAGSGRDRTGPTATNGSDVLVAFGESVPPGTWPKSRLFAAVYHGSAKTADVEELLSGSGNGHRNPVVAAGPSGSGVAWDEESGAYFTRIGADGSSLDGRGVLLSANGSGVRVAFDGTNYVAAWTEPGNIGVRWIAPATAATVAEARMTADAYQIALAASPDATYVVFADQHLRVARIPHTTRSFDPVTVAVAEHIPVSAPAVSWNGSMLLVVWNQHFTPVPDPPWVPARQTFGARVTGGLSLLDPEPIVIAEHGYERLVPGTPSVASNGRDWLVVSDLDGSNIAALRVPHDGAPDSNGARRIAKGTNAVVTWNGEQYAVAWKEGSHVRLGAVAASGEPALTGRSFVAANVAPSPLAIAPAANGEVAVTYTKVSFRPEHSGVERTFLRFMDHGTARGRVVRK